MATTAENRNTNLTQAPTNQVTTNANKKFPTSADGQQEKPQNHTPPTRNPQQAQKTNKITATNPTGLQEETYKTASPTARKTTKIGDH